MKADRLKGLGLGLVVLLAACGEDVGDPTDFSASEKPALWNPCDAIDATFVEEHFGSVAEEKNGTPTKPECRFVPDEASGQPALEANYLQYPAGLEETFAQMDLPEEATISSPAIEGADDARLIINEGEDHLGVTGFVQNDNLIQNVDVVAPAPYDRARVVAGVEAALAAFSQHAETSEVN